LIKICFQSTYDDHYESWFKDIKNEMRTYLTEQIFKIYETNPSRVKEPLEGFLFKGFFKQHKKCYFESGKKINRLL